MKKLILKITALALILFGLGTGEALADNTTYTSFIHDLTTSFGGRESYGTSYQETMVQDNYTGGKITYSSISKFILDSKNKLSEYIQDANTQSPTITYTRENGELYTFITPEDITNFGKLFTILKYKNVEGYKIGEKPSLGYESDPGFGSVISAFKRAKSENIFTSKDVKTYLASEDNSSGKTYYKAVLINNKFTELDVVIETPANKIKGFTGIKSKYLISYEQTNLTLPHKNYIDYNAMVNTYQGRFYIGDPISKVAMDIPMNYLATGLAGAKFKTTELFKSAIKNTVNAIDGQAADFDPHFTINKEGDLEGKLYLDKIYFYYCYHFNYPSGKMTTTHGPCKK